MARSFRAASITVSLLGQIAVFLGAAVVAVPLTKRLGLGAVLGYLCAGIVIGPWGLRLIPDVEQILHFGEFGVVLLLFIIGLELQPSRLWVMRKPLLGMGGAQMLLTTIALAVPAFLLGTAPPVALMIGFTLALSSTAFALQMLAEKSELTTRHGRSAFSILLFQDLAVIPLLAVIGAVSPGSGDQAATFSWLQGLTVLAAIATVVIGGRYLLHPVFSMLAKTKIHEVFTAMSLLTVIGTAMLMEQIGLSMALGAFVAGVLLSDSHYRHALEADIEPFKGLLLGLFFIAVGMSVNVGLIGSRFLTITALVVALVAAKFLVLLLVGRLFRLSWRTAFSLAAVLPQGGEFAFVVFGVAVSSNLLGQDLADLLIVVVSLSMGVTPLISAGVTALQRRIKPGGERAFDRPVVSDQPVIIAGFGRFGQIVARILRARKIPFVALDASSEHVDFVRRYGNKIYYGDASRLDLLRAARADQASVFVLTIDDVEASLRTARVVKDHFPGLQVLARARNRQHAYQLMDLGITAIWRETLFSSLEMAKAVLQGVGLSASDSLYTVNRFRDYDDHQLTLQHESHNDDEKTIYLSKKAARELEDLFEQDAREAAAGDLDQSGERS